MSNKGIKNLMIMKHGNRCWLNYKITRDNPLTYHHIKPVREGGKATEENGALVSLLGHEDFNELERLYPDLAAEINQAFIIYKGIYPPELSERIEKLLNLVRNRSVNEKTKKYKR